MKTEEQVRARIEELKAAIKIFGPSHTTNLALEQIAALEWVLGL